MGDFAVWAILEWAMLEWAILEWVILEWAISEWVIVEWAILEWAILEWAILHRHPLTQNLTRRICLLDRSLFFQECLKRGETFDPAVAARVKEEAEKRAAEEAAEDKRRKREKFVPARGNYQQKYEHLIGKDSALDAARRTELKKSYGMVSAESKRDRRTVEDIQAELRAKKRQKLDGEGEAADREGEGEAS